MKVLKEIEERRSIRKYKNQPIADEDIYHIMEAARLAPSGSNTQPWKFMIVKDEEVKKRIVNVDHKQEWMLSAPLFIVCLADMTSRVDVTQADCVVNESSADENLKLIIRDTAIAISYMLLEAQHRGIGTCWTGWYEQQQMRDAIGVPEYFYVSGILTVGYADESPVQRPRRKLEDILINCTL